MSLPTGTLTKGVDVEFKPQKKPTPKIIKKVGRRTPMEQLFDFLLAGPRGKRNDGREGGGGVEVFASLS